MDEVSFTILQKRSFDMWRSAGFDITDALLLVIHFERT